MTHGSLFSGIGGAELAAEWIGWTNIFHCDNNEFCNKILSYWFPKSKSYKDVRSTDFTQYRGQIDVLTGGFPCQPFSLAGKRKGQEDDRYLWPEMLRVIREIRPTWVVGENVGGIISMVQPGKEVEVGREASLFEENYITKEEQDFVIETICKDFESSGYSIQPILIPACAVGAPHRRDRVWFVANRNDAGAKNQRKRQNEIYSVKSFAYSDSNGRQEDPKSELLKNRQNKDEYECLCVSDVTPNTVNAGNTTQQNETDINESEDMRRNKPQPEFAGYGDNGTITDAKNDRLSHTGNARKWRNGFKDKNIIVNTNGRRQSEKEYRIKKPGLFTEKSKINDWSSFPTESPICRGNDGLSERLDGITFSKWREESIKAYGNAWVPQVAYEIFKAIQKMEE